jgi:hypothetical protein
LGNKLLVVETGFLLGFLASKFFLPSLATHKKGKPRRIDQEVLELLAERSSKREFVVVI